MMICLIISMTLPRNEVPYGGGAGEVAGAAVHELVVGAQHDVAPRRLALDHVAARHEHLETIVSVLLLFKNRRTPRVPYFKQVKLEI